VNADGSASRFQATRADHRSRRQQAIVDTALDIVTTEGMDALTMQRIAEELECGVASVYRLFTSKDVLLAELQLQALAVLQTSFAAGMQHLDDEVAAVDEVEAALARAMGAAWFWVAADAQFPHEIDLSRRLFVGHRSDVAEEQAGRLFNAAVSLLGQYGRRIDAAAEVGAIEPGSNLDRSVILLASVIGVMLSTRLGQMQSQLLDGSRIATQAIRDSFLAWGADRATLESATHVVARVAGEGRLAPGIAGDDV